MQAYRRLILAGLTLALTASASRAQVSLELDVPHGIAPALFSDNMVLQRDADVPIWGKAANGELVTVSIAGQTKVTTAVNGTWRVVLDPVPAGGPYELTVAGTNTIVISGVLFGDVWVCSGQSNMQIRRPPSFTLAQYPTIRTLTRRDWFDRPSGAAFAFAQHLQAATGVPVGLINRAASGTAIRTWLPPSLAHDPAPEVAAIVGTWEGWGEQYDLLIAPLAGFAIRGVVWWQGEQDLKLSRQIPAAVENYYHLLPALFRSWRAAWAQGDFPFVFLQLPTGGGLQLGQTPAPLPAEPPAPGIAELMRHATFHGLAEPNAAMVVSVDIEGGTHPKNREQYGERIAQAALGTDYGQSFPYSGPVYASMSIEAGNRVRLRFRENTADGLHAVGGPLQGFSISGDGETFVWASAEIEGDEVVVWNDAIPLPVAVRYAWDREPTWANLFNASGLGAAPFSTEGPVVH